MRPPRPRTFKPKASNENGNSVSNKAQMRKPIAKPNPRNPTLMRKPRPRQIHQKTGAPQQQQTTQAPRSISTNPSSQGKAMTSSSSKPRMRAPMMRPPSRPRPQAPTSNVNTANGMVRSEPISHAAPPRMGVLPPRTHRNTFKPPSTRAPAPGSFTQPSPTPASGPPRQFMQPSAGGRMRGPRPGRTTQKPQASFHSVSNRGSHAAPSAPTHRRQTLPEFNYDDLKRNCPEELKSMTMSHFPATQTLLEQSSMPVGCIVQPLSEKIKDVPVVNFADVGGVVRCIRCRCYMNPFVHFPPQENGRSWQCPMCESINETPTAYYCPLDPSTGRRTDEETRPELQKGCIEVVAASEYMVRPPMPPVYVFALDLSPEPAQSKMLLQTIRTIRKTIVEKTLLGAPRTKIGFIGLTATEVNFYSLSKDFQSPKVLTLDINLLSDYSNEEKKGKDTQKNATSGGVFLPVPEDLLVNLEDNNEAVMKILDSLEELAMESINVNTNTQATPSANQGKICLGEALMACYSVMAHIGGKLSMFLGGFAAHGIGALKQRYNPNILGSPNEHTLLKAATNFYVNKGMECSGQQISVDLYFLPPSNMYIDMASIAGLAKYTGGHSHMYAESDLQTAFASDLERSLTRETGWEGVMRVRGSSNISIKAIYGKDLMALPTTNADASFAVEFGFPSQKNEKGSDGAQFVNPSTLTRPVIIQTALLYTNSDGERRIRVLTSIVPISNSMEQLYGQLRPSNVDSVVNLFAKKGVEIVNNSGLEDLRRKLQLQLVEFVRGYKTVAKKIGETNNGPANSGPTPGAQPPAVNGNGPAPTGPKVELMLPKSMANMPLTFLAMIKSSGFRGGKEITLDERVAWLDVLSRMSNYDAKLLYEPIIYGCLANDSSKLTLQKLKATARCLRTDSVVLFMNGVVDLIWIGAKAVKFAKLGQVKALMEKKMKEFQDERLKKLEVNGDYPRVRIIHEGSREDMRIFRPMMFLDRQNFNGGSTTYEEFLQTLLDHSKTNNRFRR
eukprot:maker-scaffold_51-snap-gene-0.8-mRNA-1 protein AED:0.02 eAED:0.02 QI:71/0.83/0.71/1/0.66/0.57/7/0/1010